MINSRERPHYSKAPLTHAFLRVAFEPAIAPVAFEQLGQRIRDALHTLNGASEFDLQRSDDNDPDSQVEGVIVRSADGKTWVLATAESCVAMRVTPYESWEQFFPVFLAFWRSYNDEVEIGSPTQLAVRYTNQIELADDNVAAPLKNLLNIYPVAMPVSGMAPLRSSLTHRLGDESTAFKIVVNDGPDPDRKGERRVILDLEATATDALLQRIEGSALDDALDHLHARIDDVFNASITQQTRESLL